MSDDEQAEIAKWRELCASTDFDKPSRASAA
jgi:glucose-6-phosphate dehydrogenase assembly protein OpcA